MERIFNRYLLENYLGKYKINSFFQNDVSGCLQLHEFAQGEHIFQAGDSVDHLYFMVEGKAKVVAALKNGRSLLIRFYKPFMIMGDMELIDGTQAACNVKVIRKTLCVGISYDDLRKHCLNDPVFLRFICRNLSEKLAKNSLFSAINLLYPLENRLASYILATSDAEEKNPGASEIYTDKYTEMAELLGTSYRHLARTLDKLGRTGLIMKAGNKLCILKKRELEKLAGELYE